MVTSIPTLETKFVILQGIEKGNRFFSDFSLGEDPSKLSDGSVAYHILGYTETIVEAQFFLFGKNKV